MIQRTHARNGRVPQEGIYTIPDPGSARSSRTFKVKRLRTRLADQSAACVGAFLKNCGFPSVLEPRLQLRPEMAHFFLCCQPFCCRPPWRQ
eukprot:4317035-Pyramimonas_sp.AAC.1